MPETLTQAAVGDLDFRTVHIPAALVERPAPAWLAPLVAVADVACTLYAGKQETRNAVVHARVSLDAPAVRQVGRDAGAGIVALLEERQTTRERIARLTAELQALQAAYGNNCAELQAAERARDQLAAEADELRASEAVLAAWVAQAWGALERAADALDTEGGNDDLVAEVRATAQGKP